MSRRRWIAAVSLSFICVSGLAISVSADPVANVPIDCEGPAGEAEPGTAAWVERDNANSYCTEQRHLDQAQHPNVGLPIPGPTQDAYRTPSLHDNVRFRFSATSIGNIATEVYRPCPTDTSICPDLPEGLERFDPPYPTAILLHGVTSRKEYNWWASQPLAEAGYLVITPDTTGSISAILNWIDNGPLAGEIDKDRVGIAGHSGGGLSANAQQGNPRISALVLWDGGSTNPPGVNANARTPALYQTPDGGARTPVPKLSAPNTIGGGYGASGFVTLRDRGVDSMVIVGRATNHLDWVGGEIWGSRYAELLWVYYHNAWFDRYLKGKLAVDEEGDVQTTGGRSEAEERAFRQALAEDAFGRLVATHFDDSADRHNISQGFWDSDKAQASGDLLYGGNVPYAVGATPVADRLAFYYRSACYVSLPDYSAGDGALGDPVLARHDTTLQGDMRTDGCPRAAEGD